MGLDGDDTLWQNETRFQLTQTALRDLLRRHVPDADVDVHLAEVEMRNLRIYGYGVKAFTLSMIETAIRLTDRRIPAADLEVILGWGQKMLGAPTELQLPGELMGRGQATTQLQAAALTLDGHEVRFLDPMLARLQPKVIAGDIAAIEQSIKAMELRRRYTSMLKRPGPWEAVP